MKTSIVMLTYNKLQYTKQCIDSIRKYTDKETYELIVVDNNSIDGTVNWLEEQQDLLCIFNKENLGFPKACNQGIGISTGDNILLLNNDTLVTESWLNNLVACLYSTENIGAVGPVSNSCPYYQSIPINYTKEKDMFKFAKKFNKSNNELWEERLKLIGFCMLIKKGVINKIGLLDERFTPGNYEDDDYSIRITQAGYKIMLCKDTFIHHYGGTSFNESKEYGELLKKNEQKFKDKWGFTSAKNMSMNVKIVSLIDKEEDMKFKILEIGCGCGATLMYMKNKYKNIELYGVDLNKNALNQANFLTKSLNEDIYNIENICRYFYDVKFDYIFINDILIKNADNKKLFNKIKKLLVNDGRILLDVKNLHYRGSNKGIDENDILKPEDIIEVLSNTNYKNIDGIKIKDEYDIKSYILTAGNNLDKFVEDIKMNDIFIQIEKGINVEENVDKILQYLYEDSEKLNNVIKGVKSNCKEQCEMFNVLGVKAYEKGITEFVIPFFQASLEINEKHRDTLINMGMVLDTIGEHELSVSYLEKIEEKDEEIQALINDIKNKHIIPKENIKRKLKFLLRRIENNIEVEQSREKIYELIKSTEINGNDILNSVENDIIKKDEVLNSVAVKFYEVGFYDEIVPLFQKSYEYNKNNEDTIYNLGYFLYELGEKEVALSYFEKIHGVNEEVDELIKKIKENINE